MQKLVSYWDATWSRASATGQLILTFDDRTQEHLEPLEHDELAVLCGILRSEKNVYYDADVGELSTVPARVDDTR